MTAPMPVVAAAFAQAEPAAAPPTSATLDASAPADASDPRQAAIDEDEIDRPAEPALDAPTTDVTTPPPQRSMPAAASSKPKLPPPTPVSTDTDAVPERLSPMQTAGWWTLFGGVAVATLAGVMAGLAERQEDRALRLAVRFELDTGAQTEFADVQGDYESTLRKGRAQANAGIALAVLGLAASIAGVAVLAVAAKAQRKANPGQANPGKAAERLEWRRGGMQVRF